MIIRGINFILLTLSIGMNLIFINLLFYFYQDYNSRIVYDIDSVRQQYEISMKYYIHNACIAGVEYPEEYKELARQGYFEKGPGVYCDEIKKDFQDEIDDDINSLGKDVRNKY